MMVTLLPLVALLFSGFLLMLGHGLTGLLLPVRMAEDQVATETIGMVLSFYSIGFLLGGLYSRQLIIRAGHIRMFAACGALASTSVLLSGLVPEPWMLALMRILMGFCLACSNATVDSWLSDSASNETRGRILATNQVVLMAALIGGQFLLNIAPPTTTTLFMLAAILFCLSVVPIAMTRRTSPPVSAVTRMSLRTAFRYSPLGVVTCFFCGIMYASLLNLLPLFAGSHGLADFDLTLFMATAMFGALVLQFPVGYLSDRFDRRTVLTGLLLIAAGSSLATPLLIRENLPAAMVLVAINTGILACLYPMSIAETFDKVQKKDLVAAMSTLLVAYACGSMSGPYLASVVMSQVGNDALFLFVALFQGGLLLFVLYRMRARVALPVEDQEHFVVQSAMASDAVSELDPRTEHTEAPPPLSPNAEQAVTLAADDPAAAVRRAREVVKAEPDQLLPLTAALASLSTIDPIQLYNAMVDTLPDEHLAIIEAIATRVPDQATDLVRHSVEQQPDNAGEMLATLTHAIPEQRLELIDAAATQLDSPDELLELASDYTQSLAEEREQLRPVDRLTDTSSHEAAEAWSTLAEHAPEQAAELALRVATAMPEAAGEISEAYAHSLADDSEGIVEADPTLTHEPSPADPAVIEAATEFVSQIAERLPEQAIDAATAISEAIPEAASDLLDALSEVDEMEGLLMADLDDKPQSPFDIEIYQTELDDTTVATEPPATREPDRKA